MKLRDKIKKLLSTNIKALGWIGHDGAEIIESYRITKPRTYHHVIYTPIPLEFARIEKLLKRKLPSGYKKFLRASNGGRFFGGPFNTPHLYISGIWPEGFFPHNTSRFFPTDMLTESYYSRPFGMPAAHLKIGSYAYDGSRICIAEDESVYVRPADEQKILCTWPDFETFLLSELIRLRQFFNDELQLINPEQKTSPG
jgi:hypothetical protein